MTLIENFKTAGKLKMPDSLHLSFSFFHFHLLFFTPRPPFPPRQVFSLFRTNARFNFQKNSLKVRMKNTKSSEKQCLGLTLCEKEGKRDGQRQEEAQMIQGERERSGRGGERESCRKIGRDRDLIQGERKEGKRKRWITKKSRVIERERKIKIGEQRENIGGRRTDNLIEE